MCRETKEELPKQEETSEYSYGCFIAVTNQMLCRDDYLSQIEKVATLKPKSLILREKHLSIEEYRDLCKDVKRICDKHHVNLFVHTHIDVAKELGISNLHLPFETFEKNREKLFSGQNYFKQLSISCHNLREVEYLSNLSDELKLSEIQKKSENLRLTEIQIVLGNIFETDCKKGLAGKGLEFLSEACKKAENVPVYAIGGINTENIKKVLDAGASGGCMMSGFMKM